MNRHDDEGEDNDGIQGDDIDLEDGELEDGELDDEEQEKTEQATIHENSENQEHNQMEDMAIKPKKPNQKNEKKKRKGKKRHAPEDIGSHSDKNEEENHEDEGDNSKDKKERKKDKKRKRKEKQKKNKEEKAKKAKRAKYIDHDKVEDDSSQYPQQTMGWPSFGSSAQSQVTPPETYTSSPPLDQYGKYKVGQGKEKSPQRPYASPYKSPSGGYDSPYNSPPGPYDSPYESPPGPYDSPSEDDDEEYTAVHRKNKRYEGGKKRNGRNQQSLMSMFGGEDFIDANVAANEKHDMFNRGGNKRGGRSGKSQKKQEKSRLFRERQMERERQAMEQAERNQNKPRRTLAETPMDERPNCKFFMEGKCVKGSNCPFNHDFEPPKKMEVCKFYLIGTCQKREDCVYMHEDYPCKFYHLKGKCLEGDDCKFSHDELDDVTGPIVDKIREEEHAGGEKLKKIPSLFEIQVFPPGQGPNRPQGPNSNCPPVPVHNGPPGPGRLPGPGGPLGPPPGHPPPHGMSPTRPPMRPPGPGFYGEMGGSPMRPPPGVAQQPGLLGPPPPMMRAPHGIGQNTRGQPPMGPVPGMPYSMLGNMQNTIQSPDTEKADGQPGLVPNVQVPPQGLNQPSVDVISNFVQQLAGNSSPKQMGGNNSPKPSDGSGDAFSHLAHLPPKQRELFMRIHAHQRANVPEEKTQGDLNQAEDDNWYSSDEEEDGEATKPTSNLVAILQTLNPQAPCQPRPITSQPQYSNTGTTDNHSQQSAQQPTFNIAQMLSAIRNASTQPAQSPPQPTRADPRSAANRPNDPRQARNERGRFNQPHSDQGDSGSDNPFYHPSPVMTEGVVISSRGTEDTFPYRIHVVSVDPNSSNLSSHIDWSDPKWESDPRIQKKLNSCSKAVQRRTSADQRMKIIPTTRIEEKAGESHLQNESLPKPNDPRMQRTIAPSPPGGSPVRGNNNLVPNKQFSLPPLPGITDFQIPKPADLHLKPFIDVPKPPPLSDSRVPPMPSALKVEPSRPVDPRLSKQLASNKNSTSPGHSDSEQKQPLSHRNDPRFKKKVKSQSQPVQDHDNDSIQKQLGSVVIGANDNPSTDTDQSSDPRRKRRKSDLEYNSPLGGGGSHQMPATDAYNAYNFKARKLVNAKQDGNTNSEGSNQNNGSNWQRNNKGLWNAHISSNNGQRDSPEHMPQLSKPPPPAFGVMSEDMKAPPILEAAVDDKLSIKDMFKTIDPTASPFC